MKIILIIVVVLVVVAGYMRYECTGIFGKVWTFYSDMQGNDFEDVECKFIFSEK